MKWPEMNLPLSSETSFTGSHKQRNTKSEHTNAARITKIHGQQLDPLYLYLRELWPLSPFLLFFTLWSSSEHDFMWSNNQKIKSTKFGVYLGHTISVNTFYGQEKLKETAGHFVGKKRKQNKTKKHCLMACWWNMGQICLSAPTQQPFMWPYPQPKSFPAHFFQAVCQPVLERLLSLQDMGSEINYSPVHLQTQMLC